MRALTVLAIAAPILVLGSEAPAIAQHMNASDSQCRNSGTTVAMVNCLAKAGKESDAELNQVYGRIMKVLDAGERQQLQKSERLWIAYREAACLAERGLFEGGTGANPAYLACVDAETRHHLSDLQVTYRLRLQKFGQ